MSVRHVEGLKERVTCIASHKDIDAAAVAFGGTISQLPSAATPHPGRKFRKNAGTTHLRVKKPRNPEGRIANHFSFQTMSRKAPEQQVLWICFGGRFVEERRL